MRASMGDKCLIPIAGKAAAAAAAAAAASTSSWTLGCMYSFSSTVGWKESGQEVSTLVWDECLITIAGTAAAAAARTSSRTLGCMYSC